MLTSLAMGQPLGFAALALVAGSMVLWFSRMKAVDIPKDRTPFVVAWAAGALLGLAALVSEPGWLGGGAAGIATLAGTLFTVLVGISRQRVALGAIRVGSALPEFDAPDQHGETFSSAALAGAPVLLKFFRGHW